VAKSGQDKFQILNHNVPSTKKNLNGGAKCTTDLTVWTTQLKNWKKEISMKSRLKCCIPVKR
jgi:hypothetical protein